MEFLTQKSENGIVKCVAFSDNFKKNYISFNFFYPLNADTATKIALLAGVLKRGNEVYGEMDKIAAFLDLNYGANYDISVAKVGEMQQLSFDVTFIDDKYALDNEKISKNMVDFITCCILSPIKENNGFKASFVKQEKQNLKDRIASLINDKMAYSFEKCKQVMFANEKYGIYEQGDIDKIDEITAESLYQFYTEFLKKAMLVINYSGVKCDTDDLFSDAVSKIDFENRIGFETEIGKAPETINDVTEQMNVAQSKLNLGFRLGDAAIKDLFAFKMFNVIFGASPTSKLFMNVREKLSLCYYCSSSADVAKNVMFVYSGIETRNAKIAREEILRQLDAMKKGDFTNEEFENAKTYLIDSYIQAGDSAPALSSIQTAAYIQGHNLTPKQQIEQIQNVTAKRVIDVAADITLDTVYLLKGIGGDSYAE